MLVHEKIIVTFEKKGTTIRKSVEGITVVTKGTTIVTSNGRYYPRRE
jgi:hypothetical protein